MTESIGTARLDIVVDTSSLDAGVNKAKKSTQDMAKASQDASQKMDAGTKRQVAALERQIATLGKSRSEVIRWRIEQQTSGRVASELTAKLDAQSKKLSAVSATMSKVGGAAKAAVLGWASLLAASVSVGAAFAGIKNSIDFADKLNDINQRLGISAEALSGWAYAAQQTGTDIDGLGIGLKKLAKNMAEALDPKSSQANLFTALGVSIKDAKGDLRSLEDVLPEIASGFKNIQNETLKAAVAQEVFGKSGTDLIEFLNQGADGLGAMRDRARDLGIELSQGTLSGADQFNDKVGDLKVVTQALFTQLANELLPTLTKLVDKLTEVADEGNKSGGIIKWIGNQAEAAANDFDFMSKSLDALGDVFGGLKDSAVGYYHALLAIKNLDLGEGKQAFAEMQVGSARSRDGLTRDVRNVGNATPAVTIPGMDFGFKFPGQKPSFSAVPVGGVGAIEPSREAAVNRALGGSGAKKTHSGRVEDPVAKALDDARKLAQAEEQVQARLDAIDETRFRAIEGWADLTAQLNGPLAEAELDHGKRMADIQRLGALSGATAEQIAAAKAKEAAAYQQTTDAIREQMDALENPKLVETLDGLRQVGYDFLVDLPKQGRDAWKNMLDDLERMATQWAAKGVIEQLFGKPGTTGADSSGGDWIGKALGLFAGGWAHGGAFAGGSPVSYFAKGDVFDRPMAFGMAGGRLGVMGEAGPEAIMPLTRGRDGKLGVRVEGGRQHVGPPQIMQNVTIQGRVDQRTLYQIERESAKGAARAMRRG
ncbi:hypothetical protein GCM10027431_32660 [Lysobacter rhizosphaerae]